MTENSPGEDVEQRAESLHRALSESQQQEREELEADMERQQSADDRIVAALSNDAAPSTAE